MNSLRSLLADIPDTCYLFAYEFTLDGTPLNDFHPLPENAYAAGTKLHIRSSTCLIDSKSRMMMQLLAFTSVVSER